MINENSVYMKKINKVAKKIKKKNNELHYSLCLQIAFKQVDKKRTIKIAKVFDIIKQIADKGLFKVIGI